MEKPVSLDCISHKVIYIIGTHKSSQSRTLTVAGNSHLVTWIRRSPFRAKDESLSKFHPRAQRKASTLEKGENKGVLHELSVSCHRHLISSQQHVSQLCHCSIKRYPLYHPSKPFAHPLFYPFCPDALQRPHLRTCLRRLSHLPASVRSFFIS